MTMRTPFPGQAGGLPFTLAIIYGGSIEETAAYLVDLIRFAKRSIETAPASPPGSAALMDVIENLAANLGRELENNEVDRLIRESGGEVDPPKTAEALRG